MRLSRVDRGSSGSVDGIGKGERSLGCSNGKARTTGGVTAERGILCMVAMAGLAQAGMVTRCIVASQGVDARISVFSLVQQPLAPFEQGCELLVCCPAAA